MAVQQRHYYCQHHDREHTMAEYKGLLCPDFVFYEGQKDLIKFGRLFMPGDFIQRDATPVFHHEIAQKFITTKPGSRQAMIVPRGFAKSTLMKTGIIHKLCYRGPSGREFIPWVCETQGQAIDHILYIQQQLEQNPWIRYYFGDMYTKGRWTRDSFETSKEDLIIAMGTTQRMRGRSHKNLRYTGIVLDDFESEGNTKTPESRQALKELISSALFPSLEETVGREGWVWLSGTIVHDDSFLSNIKDLDDDLEKSNLTDEEKEALAGWDVSFYQATHDAELNDDSIPLWPDRFSIEKLRQKKRVDFALAPHKFYQEYMNEARDRNAMPVQTDEIKYYRGEVKTVDNYHYLLIKDEAIPVILSMGVDIAGRGISAKHDYHGIVVLATDAERNRYIVELHNLKMPAYDLTPIILGLARKYEPLSAVNIENVGSQDLMRDIVARGAAADLALTPGIVKGVLPPTRIPKHEKLIQSLGPIINNGKMFIKEEHEVFKHQAERLPSPKHDDLLDAYWCADDYSGNFYTTAERFPANELDFVLAKKKKDKQDRLKGRKRLLGNKIWKNYDWKRGRIINNA